MPRSERDIREAIERDKRQRANAQTNEEQICTDCGQQLDVLRALESFYYKWTTPSGIVQKMHIHCTPDALKTIVEKVYFK